MVIGPAQFLRKLMERQRAFSEFQIGELKKRVRDNFRDFVRQASEIPGCHLVSAEPFIFRAHDKNVDRYRIAGTGAVLVGMLIAAMLSLRATPSVLMAAGTVGLFFVLGKGFEAIVQAVPDKRFFSQVDGWFRVAMFAASGSASIVILGRVSNELVATLIEPLEPASWLSLEAALIVMGSIGMVAAHRFGWSRRFVAVHLDLMASIREATPTLVGARPDETPDMADILLDEGVDGATS